MRLLLVNVVCVIGCLNIADSLNGSDRPILWKLDTPVFLRGNASMVCMINENDKPGHMAWRKEGQVIGINDASLNSTKYDIFINYDRTSMMYNLVIKNIAVEDLNLVYKCESGFLSAKGILPLNEDSFIALPKTEDIYSNVNQTKEGSIIANVIITFVYPKPMCIAEFQDNDISRFSETMYTEESIMYTMKFNLVYQSHECGNISISCVVGKAEISLLHHTYEFKDCEEFSTTQSTGNGQVSGIKIAFIIVGAAVSVVISVVIFIVWREVKRQKQNNDHVKHVEDHCGHQPLIGEYIEFQELDREKEDSNYINTRATDYVFFCIKKHKCVSVIGPPGSGKTAIVRHIALKMKRSGFTIVYIKSARELIEHFESDRKTLYIADDIFGLYTANHAQIKEWKISINEINCILEKHPCKLVLTCRLQIFMDKGLTCLPICKLCECNLISENLSLTFYEKQVMTNQFFQTNSIEALNQLKEYDCLPVLCKLYLTKKNSPHFNLDMFLRQPFSFYCTELTRTYNDCEEGKYTCCVLLLLVIFNNKLTETNLLGIEPKFVKIIEDVLSVCEVNEYITGEKLKSQINIMIGTWVSYDHGFYKSKHDKMFDFLAFYFGSQHELIDLLIKHTTSRFIGERFDVTEKEKTGISKSEHYQIPVNFDNLQMYVKRVFNDMVGSSNLNEFIRRNTNFEKAIFREKLTEYIQGLDRQNISELIAIGSNDFFNQILVTRENEMQEYSENRIPEYRFSCIVIPDDLLHIYVEEWFDRLVNSKSTEEFIKSSKSLMNATLCSVLRSYTAQLSSEQISTIVQTASEDFLNRMFVMANHDNGENRYEYFSIVIPPDLLQFYIHRWFACLIKSSHTKEFINSNGSIKNAIFRTAFRAFTKMLDTEQIASIIRTASEDFVNRMFVMKDDDINGDTGYECVCIVIPCELLQMYIERWFDCLIRSNTYNEFLNSSRPLKNVSFCVALRAFTRQLSTDKIASLFQTVSHDFLNRMFVMTEKDIQNKVDYQNESI